MGRARGGLILLCVALASMLLCADYAQAARMNKNIGYGALHPGGKQCQGFFQSRNCKKVPANHYHKGCRGGARCRGHGGKKKEKGRRKEPCFDAKEEVQSAAGSPAPAPAPAPTTAPARFNFHFWGV